MELNLTFELGEDDKERLATILHCSEDCLAEEVKPYAQAAVEEYIRMFLGQKVFANGSDIREYRLFLLIKHAFKNHIPDEHQIIELFHTKVPQTRSLIQSVMTNYQYQLSSAIRMNLRMVIESAVESMNDDGYLLTIDNLSIVNELNRILASQDGTLPPIGKKRGTVSTYILKLSSREHLLEYLGIEVQEEAE